MNGGNQRNMGGILTSVGKSADNANANSGKQGPTGQQALLQQLSGPAAATSVGHTAHMNSISRTPQLNGKGSNDLSVSDIFY